MDISHLSSEEACCDLLTFTSTSKGQNFNNYIIQCICIIYQNMYNTNFTDDSYINYKTHNFFIVFGPGNYRYIIMKNEKKKQDFQQLIYFFSIQ